MDWLLPLSAILGGLLFVMALGMPVAFAFLLVNVLGIVILQGVGGPLQQLVLSMISSVASFALVPIPLFVFMGVVLWYSKLGQQAVDAIDQWVGRLPGRLSLLTIASGSVFSALSGSTMANTAMLGTMLLPELRRRGYARDLSIGPIMAGGGLAMMIPPSALAVILASIAKLSIAKILLAAIIPGLMMALFYAIYIIGRSALYPEAAPAYEVKGVRWGERLHTLARDLLPLGFIVFSVTGLMVLGVGTPTEAAALGALSSIALVAFYRRLTWGLLRAALLDSMRISVMTFTIMAAAIGFSQILAYSGATKGLLDTVMSANVAPILLIIATQLIVLVLGCFMEQIAIMLITLPIFVPIVIGLGYDPIWFAVLMLVNLETALMTPPFGLLLVVMKGVTPETTFGQIYTAATPYVVCNLAVMAILIVFPQIVTDLLVLVLPK
ncbi:MAG: TRAP transporter large permease subunit [Xanthobacteraceae bacterium]